MILKQKCIKTSEVGNNQNTSLEEDNTLEPGGLRILRGEKRRKLREN